MDQPRLRARAFRNQSTEAERTLWRSQRARQREGLRFRRQVPIAGYIVDFVCPQAKLAIEVDGGQHVEQMAYDTRRTQTLQDLGYTVLRHWNDDVLLRSGDVVADIYRALTKRFTPPQPSPSLCEREGAEATLMTASEAPAPATGNGHGKNRD